MIGGLTSSLENSPAFVPDHIEGIGSLYLNGSFSVRLDTNVVLQNPTYACTLSFWFKPTRLQGLQVLYDEGGSQSGLAVRLNGSMLQAGLSSSNVLTSASLTGITSNTWHFVTVTCEGANGNPGMLGLYCDGRSALNTNAPGSIPTHINDSGFGAVNSNYAFNDAGGRFTGWIDDVRLTKAAANPPNLNDQDGDGLTDSQELVLQTNPTKADSDGDGISDGFEILRTGTNPNSAQDSFKVRIVNNPPGFVIPATSAFTFVFEQWNPANGQWTVKAGPFVTEGVSKTLSLTQLGLTPADAAVILRVKATE